MRVLNFGPSKKADLYEAPIPAPRMARLQQAFRRRLDDDLNAIFNRACLTNDLEVATDLLAVLEKCHARRVVVHGLNRRVNDTFIQTARDELEQLAARMPPTMVGGPETAKKRGI